MLMGPDKCPAHLIPRLLPQHRYRDRIFFFMLIIIIKDNVIAGALYYLSKCLNQIKNYIIACSKLVHLSMEKQQVK